MSKAFYWGVGFAFVALVCGCRSTETARTSERVELRAAYRPTTSDVEASASYVFEVER